MDQRYHDTLLLYYEEEIMGEAYFEEMAGHFDEQGAAQKLRLLAAVERHAAKAVRPLIDRYGLSPRQETELAAIGRTHVEPHRDLDWRAFVAHMAERYPAYIDDFEALERMAPAADRPALEFLTEHEHAAIEFANLENAGSTDSTAPLLAYLNAGSGTD